MARDVRAAAAGTDWIKMIIPDEVAPEVVAGNVALWSHDEDGEPVSEIGWMVLPEFQGHGQQPHHRGNGIARRRHAVMLLPPVLADSLRTVPG